MYHFKNQVLNENYKKKLFTFHLSSQVIISEIIGKNKMLFI